MRIAVLQNHPAEGPARIHEWADQNRVELITFRAFEGHFPELIKCDGLIIMGGSMNVTEALENPNLSRAIAVIGSFLDAGKPVLGICLGAQMMTAAAGGEVIPGPQKEIGWYPIAVSHDEPSNLSADLPAEFVVFHWHGQQIVAPEGAHVFASTPVCPVQALQLAPNQLGLQCHLEVSRDSIQAMSRAFSGELEAGGPGVQSPDEIKAGLEIHGETCFRHLCDLLGRVFLSKN